MRRAALSIAAGVLFVMIPALLFAAWGEDLVEYRPNPIFTPPSGGRIYYPTVIYDDDGFGTDGVGPFYRAWFSDGHGISTAYSNDGLNWVEGHDCLGLKKPHHAAVVYDAAGFGNGSAGPFYRIWYWHTNKLYNVAAIRTAESYDGIDWFDDQKITQDGAMPLITGDFGDWNRGSYGPAHVLYQPGAPNAGDDPFGYEYVMYYDGTTGGFEQVGLGYSTDGIHWKRYGDDPVLASGADWEGPWGLPDPWDSSYVGFGTVLRDSEDEFHFWYSGGTISMDEGIGYAYSDDGLVWIKDAANPLVQGTVGEWNEESAYTPSVMYDANRFSGHGDNCRFKLWYAGRDGAGDFHLGYLGRPVATVTVDLGPANPEEEEVEEGEASQVIMQLVLDNDDVESVTLDNLKLYLAGTAFDGGFVGALALYRDSNPDGLLGDEDELIAEADVDGAEVELGPFAEEIDPSSSAIWLIVASFKEASRAGWSIRATLQDAADFTGAGNDSNDLVVSLAPPLDGTLMAFVAVGEAGEAYSEEGGQQGGGGAGAEDEEGSGQEQPAVPPVGTVLEGTSWMLFGGGGCSFMGATLPGASSVALVHLGALLALLVGIRRRKRGL